MTLPNPVAGDTVQASDINGIVNALEGSPGATAPYSLLQSTGNFQITLPDAAGATQFRILDSTGTDIFHITSLGTISAGAFTPTSFIFPLSATPSQTTLGQAVYNSTKKTLTIGDGSKPVTVIGGLDIGATWAQE